LCHGIAALLKKRSTRALQGELLVGFEPVAQLVTLLRARFDHLAEFCAGGVDEVVVAIKWRPAAFAPAPLRVPSAHTALPLLVSTSGADGGGGQRPVTTVVDAASVLHDILGIGEGLIAEVVLPESSALL
jgi:U3 small nucleolar RNA-associated protein 22